MHLYLVTHIPVSVKNTFIILEGSDFKSQDYSEDHWTAA